MGTAEVMQRLIGNGQAEPEQGKPESPTYGKSMADRILNRGSKVQEYDPVEPEFQLRPGQTGLKNVIQRTPGAAERPQPTFGTEVKAASVADIGTKMDILSREMGIPRENFGIQNKKIVFRNPSDNKVYLASPGTFGKAAKKLAAGVVARPLSTAGGAIGAYVGGVPGAAIGGSIGRAIEKGIASVIFNEPVTPGGIFLDVAGEGAINVATGGAGKMIAGKLSAAKVAQPLREGMGEVIRHLSPKDVAKGKIIEALAKKHNLNLAPHQIYRKEQMEGVWRQLRGHPQTANAVQEFEKAGSKNIEASFEKFLKTVSQTEDPFLTGGKLRKVGQKLTQEATEIRSKAARPFYNKAFETKPRVEVKSILGEIDSQLPEAQGETRRHLLKIKKLISQPNESLNEIIEAELKTATGRDKDYLLNLKEFAGLPTPKLFDAKGNLVESTMKLPETKGKLVKSLHGVKLEFDRIINKKGTDSLDNVIKGKYKFIRSKLVTELEKNADYKQAQKVFSKLSPSVDRLSESAISRLSKIKDDKGLLQAADSLFKEQTTSHSLLKYTKALIEHKNPQLWQDAIGAHMRSVYEGLKATETGNIANVAGKLHKQFFGSTKKRNIMRAAMKPEQYKNFEGLMRLYKHATFGAGGQSTTSSQLAFRGVLEGGIGEAKELAAGAAAGAAIGGPPGAIAGAAVVATKKSLLNRINESMVEGKRDKLLKLLTEPGASDKISKMRRLKPGSEKLVVALTNFLGGVGIDVAGGKVRQQFRTDKKIGRLVK